MIKVKVEKLQKSFGSLEVLKGIDLEVKKRLQVLLLLTIMILQIPNAISIR